MILLQISQSYLKAILKTPQVLYQIPLFVAALVAADSGKTLFQITADKILPDDIGDDRSEIAVCPGADWAAGSPGNAQPGGKAPTLVISTVIGRIFHGAVLQARLPFQFMAVKKHVQAALDLVVLVAAAFNNFVFITSQAHTVVIVTFQISIA